MIRGILKITLKQLNLALILPSGQSFRWKRIQDSHDDRDSQTELWVGIINNYVVSLKQNSQKEEISYTVYNGGDRKNLELQIEKILFDYFQLQVPLEELYLKWSDADEHFAKISEKFAGIRILKQDPVENLFSFICSSNNNIQRITKMVDNLCTEFGEEIAEVENLGKFYSFPKIKTLAGDAVESRLKELGFGYRAKFISKTAKFIMSQEQPEEWLTSLRCVPYEVAHKQLLELPGVGAKVADCVCLMSLGHHQAVPVDTHVWQIATSKYLPQLAKRKFLTEKTYKQIADFLRQRFEPFPGWAHSVMFCADLRQFK